MTRARDLCIGVAVWSAVATAAVSGQEEKITRAELPNAVARMVDEQAKGATVRGLTRERENGHMYYEAELTVNGHGKDVTIDSAGNVVEIEEVVELATLSAPVQAGIKAKAGGGTITKVESITKHGTLVAYEAHVSKDGKRSELQVGPDGKPLDHEE